MVKVAVSQLLAEAEVPCSRYFSPDEVVDFSIGGTKASATKMGVTTQPHLPPLEKGED